MSNYRLANTKVQWYQDNFPGATMHLTPSTAVVVLHTTEGASWPGYSGGAVAPNYTAMPNFKKRTLDWRAHFPDEKSSRALQNQAGGVETNTLNAVQVELVGTCDPKHKTSWPGVGKAGVNYLFWPDAPDWALEGLADFLRDMHERHGLQLKAPTFLPYPSSFGSSKVRFSFTQWRGFAGICGHQHVPENSHGDPGSIDIKRVISLAKPAVAKKADVQTPVRIDELSGRFDRKPSLLRAAVERSAKHADIILCTEVTDPARAAALGMVGWTTHRNPAKDLNEIAILTRDSEWAPIGRYEVAVLGPDLGPGGKVVAGIQALRNVHTGARLVVSIEHLPAGVEGRWARGQRRADAHRAAVQELRALHRTYRKHFKPHGEMAFADWNLNLHRKFVQDWIAEAWPALSVPRKEIVPKGGTHAGLRLIDWFVRRRVVIHKWQIMRATAASDHRGIHVEGVIHSKGKK